MPMDASVLWAECVIVDGGAVRTYLMPAIGRPSWSAMGAWCSNSYQARFRTATRDIAVSLIEALSVVAVRMARRREFLCWF
jgi:hypothetical protein